MTTTTPTTTRPTARPQLLAPPAFEVKRDGETLAQYGERAMLYALALPHPAIFSQLSGLACEAAADCINHAVTQRDISQTTLACLQALQAALRATVAARRAAVDRTLAGILGGPGGILAPAAVQADPLPPVPPAAGGGGGSKVKRPVPPTRPSGPAGFASPDETGQQGRFRRVPALQLSADDAF